MKGFFVMLFLTFNVGHAFAQADLGSALVNDNFADSILVKIKRTADDTGKVKSLIALGDYYTFIRQDSSIFYLIQGIELAEKINDPIRSYTGYLKLAFVLNTASNYGAALDMAVRSLRIAEKVKNNRQDNVARSYNTMATINRRNGNDSIARKECLLSIEMSTAAGTPIENLHFGPYFNLALIYLKWKNWDSALYYAKTGYDIVLHYPPRAQAQISVTSSTLANVYEMTGKMNLARDYYIKGIESDKKFNVPLLRVRLYNNFAQFYKYTGQLDSCIYYAKASLSISRSRQFGEHVTDAASLVAGSYEKLGKPDSALKYTKIFMAARDTIFNQSKLQQIQLLNFDEGQRQKDIQRAVEQAQERYSNRIKYYALSATAALFLFISVMLYRNNRSKQVANMALQAQKNEVEQQRAKAECTLDELRSTQAQLIQSEKMASLGELTAGIAHEIQNPLNFVNNFSEVNAELIGEMQQAMENGNLKEAKEISGEIKSNEEKIIHHGKRADSIVRGMLQHSQSNAGIKESTDVNALADEYLRLAFHGLRAKDHSFNAIMKTDFDNSVGRVELVTQDIGRVLLNLYNNAFYALADKKRQLGGNFEPAISVSTEKKGNSIFIYVEDNGCGIPEKVINKIFQPFFTTKPAGQGTGLGLSLSYDIIKAAGGELKVETTEGEGTEFIIQIPAA